MCETSSGYTYVCIFSPEKRRAESKGERLKKREREREGVKRIYGGANEAPRIESRPNLRR